MPTGSKRSGGGGRKVVAVANLQEFFRDSLEDALRSQNVRADAHTAHYVVNLLTLYARSERFYDTTDNGYELRPLAFMLSDALESDSEHERNQLLQRLGDVALFIAGFFSHSFARKLVDIDYYVSMGGTAYGHLSESMRKSSRSHVFCSIFDELAGKFQRFVDVLNEIAEMAYTHTDRDIMRLYEVWLRTGSPRAADKLRQLGVVPITSYRPTRRQ